MRRELRKYYGAEWKRFRLELIAQTGGEICSHCHIEMARGINGAHLDHNPRNPASVILLCPGCHARNDAPHRIAIMRRRQAKARGQMWLSPEMEWSPFAAWEIPAWIYNRLAQLRLFDSQ